ncbi:MAG: substrate-binding domain-containing protein [Albidovulum sp.]|nr:substrate-binding domain-containing protein [Albidovulum sp.]MDE0533117.1 substrate-binding domain-containing protein [Albidovulum sp.]
MNLRLAVCLFFASIACENAWGDTLRLAVTTSFHNSGLSDILLPIIGEDLDIEVHLLVVGTGQALRLGRAGDVDALLVHSKSAEEKFVENGYATHRREIMYNDFVLIGRAADPAKVAEAETAVDAFSSIASAEATFVSRGDDSGTHNAELSLWRDARLNPNGFGEWYRAVGAGMGAALNTASGMDAYILADRASWLNFGNKGDLVILFEGDSALFNQYSFLPIDPVRHPHVKGVLANRLEEWLAGPRAGKIIDGYRLGGESLFTHNARN